MIWPCLNIFTTTKDCIVWTDITQNLLATYYYFQPKMICISKLMNWPPKRSHSNISFLCNCCLYILTFPDKTLNFAKSEKLTSFFHTLKLKVSTARKGLWYPLIMHAFHSRIQRTIGDVRKKNVIIFCSWGQ